MAARDALIVFAKPPLAGEVKTRLVPPLSADAAADLYRSFLLDTVARVARSAERACLVAHPPHPADAEARLRALLPPAGLAYLPQRGADLGQRLAAAFQDARARGFRRVVIVGSDTPTLPPSLIEDAFAALAKHDAAIGPAADGGYYLIGLREPRDELFNGISWSTDTVYRQTIERARELGLRTRALQPWYDVDTPSDLAFLREQIGQMELEGFLVPQATAAWLREHPPT